MSLSDVRRERHYAPGYVYIAGSLSGRLIKFGRTKNNIRSYQKRLQNQEYGSIGDWVILYCVWVDQAGRIETNALRRLWHYKTTRTYKKNGSWQEAHEIVQCSFSPALEALSDSIGDNERSNEWQSDRCRDFEFERHNTGSNGQDGLTRELELLPPETAPFNPMFFKKVAELELSIRSANCLRNDNIVYIGDLVRKTESEMLRTPNFGRKSLNEIKEVLAQMGLHLGVEVPGWPPGNVEELFR